MSAEWRGRQGPRHARRTKDRVLASCNLDSHQVYALGPAERCVRDFDCWREEEVKGPFSCAISTDGIGRGLGKSPLKLLDELENLQAAGAENPAQRFIERAIEEHPKDFDDNLTLAIIQND